MSETVLSAHGELKNKKNKQTYFLILDVIFFYLDLELQQFIVNYFDNGLIVFGRFLKKNIKAQNY